MAIAKRAMDVNSDINVTPMADVMLVLLIIFMVVTPMLQKGITVDLARTDNPRQMPVADKEDALVVAVQRDGQVYLGTDKTAADMLTQKIRDKIANRMDKTVYVRADANARYKHVVEVVDNVRAAGVDQLGLLTEQRKSGSFADHDATGAARTP
jgi:biopolymer transport protein ExbD/biopolymer transport protein TolR